MADGVWKGVQPYVIGHFKPLSLNKFLDPSTPSMRKGDDGETGGKKGKKYQPSGEGGTRSPPATPHRLLNPKWPMRSGDPSTPSMRKGDNGEKKEKRKEKKRKKIKTFLVATNVVASRPPERRPTGTPTTRAKIRFILSEIIAQASQRC